jgi:acyl-CoA-binding protein
VSGSADQAIQAIKAMQKHKADEVLLSLGALCVTGNEGDRRKVPVKDVSACRYAAFSAPCQWDISQIKPSFCFPDWN